MSLEVIHRSYYVLISHSINPETSKPQIVIENGVAYGGMRPVICVVYIYSRLMMYVCNVFRPSFRSQMLYQKPDGKEVFRTRILWFI